MSEEIRLWKIQGDGAIEEISRSSLDYERRLESWISKDISIIDSNLMIIGRQVPTGFCGYIDLLCMDTEGDLVIIELKKNLTPREVTAQTLDYASWIEELNMDQVAEIAGKYLENNISLEMAFSRHFDREFPETINQNHSMLIVAADVDSSTERIIRYLSDTHGVGINVVHFKYFKMADGQEFLARTFLIEPEIVQNQIKSKGSYKKRSHLTLEEIEEYFEMKNLGHLYKVLTVGLETIFTPKTRTHQIAFMADFKDRKRVIFNILPFESSSEIGICYQIYSFRLAEVLEKPVDEIISLLPPGAEPWIYYTTAPENYKGFKGFFRSIEEITLFIKGLMKE
jgi:hypothetical protein